MNEFTLPTNIKQIGSIGDGIRIYMEDYVCTYLYQYAEAGGFDERIALLIGRQMVIDGQTVLFINGAVQGKHTEEKNGLLTFTDESGAYAEAMIKDYFDGMEVVGWMQSQPTYGIYLNHQYAAYHMREFTKSYQVLFVMDPLERINAFYAYNADMSRLAEAKGYFIYYDKNKAMHEYMLKNKSTDAAYKTQIPAVIELPEGPPEKAEKTEKTEKAEQGTERVLRGSGDEVTMDRPEDTPEAFIRRHQTERVARKHVQEQRRTLNLLVSLSAVLFIICFVMGAGLIQNQDRIADMEGQIVQLSTAYRDLMVQLTPDGTASVFAAQNDEKQTQATPTNAPTNAPTPTVAANGAAVIEEDGAALADQTAEVPPEEPAGDVQGTDDGDATETALIAPSESILPEIPESYTIQPGDNLNWISIQFYGDRSRVADILALNGLDDPNKIMAGYTILLPGR